MPKFGSSISYIYVCPIINQPKKRAQNFNIMNATTKNGTTKQVKFSKGIDLVTLTKQLNKKDYSKQLDRIFANCNSVEQFRRLFSLLDNKESKIESKVRINFKKLVRAKIFELSKGFTTKDAINKGIERNYVQKTATEKQNKGKGFNILVKAELKSLGKCIQILDKVFIDVKNEPNKVKEFIETNERFNKITGKVDTITTSFSVSYDTILHDIISFSRKNVSYFYAIKERIELVDLGTLTESKVKKFLESNIELLQNLKVQIKAESKVKK